MNAPNPHEPPPPPHWATPWHTVRPEPEQEPHVERPPPVSMVLMIAASCLAIGLILGRMF